MEVATNPQSGVEPELSVEQRLVSFFAKSDKTQQQAPIAPPQTAVPEPKADADELPGQEIADQAEVEQPTEEAEAVDGEESEQSAEDPQSSGDEFEIVHNGTQVKLDRARTIELATKGFDYERKNNALNEKVRTFETTLQKVSELEQVLPLIAQEQAQVAAFRAQLAPYEKVDWVQLATDNPLDYPRHRAQFDILVQQYNAAEQRVGQVVGAYQKQQSEVKQQHLAQQFERLTELVPEWKSPEKYRAGTQELQQYIMAQGVDPQSPVLQAVLGDAMAIALARKAMLYDKSQSSKGVKLKQMREAPPMAKPGSANPAPNQATQQYQKQRAQFKKTGDWRDMASLIAAQERSKK